MRPCCASREILSIVLREIQAYADGWLLGELSTERSPFFDGRVFRSQISSLVEWAQQRLDGRGESDFLGGTCFKTAMEMVEELGSIGNEECV